MKPPRDDPVQLTALAVQKADAAEATLRAKLKRSVQMGVDLPTNFSFFDIHDRGWCTGQEFLSALQKININLPPAAAELFLARIGTNSDGNIGLHEFQSFVDKVQRNLRQLSTIT